MSDLPDLLLASPRLTLAAAESLTTGKVQAAIGAVSGASRYWKGGLTAYTIAQKVALLGVDVRQATQDNAVSERVALAMAKGICRRFDSDLGLATTGYAEPYPELGFSNPFAWWAVAHRLRRGRWITRTGCVQVPGKSRVEVQDAVASAVLVGLRNYLENFRA